jgi:uncharacterized protein (UPF0128 family)
MTRVLILEEELGIKSEKQWKTTWGRDMRTHGNKSDINFGTTHGINLRNTCEGHMRTTGIRYGKFGKEYEVKQGTN